jgi:hypothetical protein
MHDELCDKHYRDHVDKDFYPGLKKFMTSARLVAMVLEGPIDEIREEALALRKMFKPKYDNPENLIHASDSIAAAEYEVDLWFPEAAWDTHSFDDDLYDLIDGLFAYDGGCTDSGIKDDAAKEKVKKYLENNENADQMLWDFLRKYDPKLGYGLSDVVDFIKWLEDEMDYYIK